MSNPDLFNTKNHKYSSRISGLATILMAASIVLILAGIFFALTDSEIVGGGLILLAIFVLMVRPIVDGFGFLVYNAENQVLKDMDNNE